MGRTTGRWQENGQKAIPVIPNARMQGHLHREPGLQRSEDPNFPTDPFYNPPEDKTVSVNWLRNRRGSGSVQERAGLIFKKRAALPFNNSSSGAGSTVPSAG
jgi:hypothetical protein